MEGLSDALRMEVAQFGIDVVLIEPGPVRTPWNDVAVGSMTGDGDGVRLGRAAGGDPYAAFKQAVAGSFESVNDGPMALSAPTPTTSPRSSSPP